MPAYLASADAVFGLPTVAVQGPGNSLWVYWEASSGQWQGPLGVGGPGSTFSSPSLAFDPNGLPTVAVQGPGNSLWVYWQASNAQWYGPLGVGGPGSAFSSPSLGFDTNGLPNVAVQGPSNSLWFYWEASGGQWQGPLGVGGPGSTFSSPSLGFETSGPAVAVQGPSDSLWFYWEASGGQWQGPLGVGGPGSTFSSPSLAAGLTSSSSGPVGLQLPPLALGDTGPAVLALQDRLSALGYWLGIPDGSFGDSTQQALYALQKAAQIPRTGTLTSATLTALNEGVVPAPRSSTGYEIEVDLEDDLLMVVDNGGVEYTLNTSTGGGYTYTDEGVTSVADTPTGQFQIYRQVDGLVVDSLGALWMPKFFDDGFAIHGDSSVPPVPISHGCVRISDEAIDWVWANNIMPIGTAVWIY
jgi:lipoprotein-anchoring transpeptidase ErfK/SrfK